MTWWTTQSGKGCEVPKQLPKLECKELYIHGGPKETGSMLKQRRTVLEVTKDVTIHVWTQTKMKGLENSVKGNTLHLHDKTDEESTYVIETKVMAFFLGKNNKGADWNKHTWQKGV